MNYTQTVNHGTTYGSQRHSLIVNKQSLGLKNGGYTSSVKGYDSFNYRSSVNQYSIKSPIKHEDYPEESEDDEVNPFNVYENHIIEKGGIEEPEMYSEELLYIASSEFNVRESVELTT